MKPKRKPVHVESHFDDLGDDLSGLGDDAAFLTADVTRSDWTDDESDDEANPLVHALFGPNQMHVSSVFALQKVFHALHNTEPVIMKLSANQDPAMATLEVRKYNEAGPHLDVTAQVQITDAHQYGVMSEYARSQPALAIVIETLPHMDGSQQIELAASPNTNR